MRLLSCFAIFFFLVLSCTHPTVDKKLDCAEQCMNSSPDKALSLLKEIPQGDLLTSEEKAHYALLMSMALDKNYIDVQNDSLISIAVNYYSHTDDADKRMKALYYNGIVQKNMRNYPAAVISLEKAQREATSLNDYLYLGLIARNKGVLFNHMANRSSALKNTEEAVHWFKKGGFDEYASYGLLSLATDYYNSKEYDKALYFLNREELESYNLTQHNAYKLIRAAISIEKGIETEQAIRLYNSVPQTSYDIQDYGYLAIAYERLGKKDSADFWINQGYHIANNDVDSAAIHYIYAQIQAKRGLYPSAYALIDKAMTTQDSFTQSALEESLNVALKEYYHDELDIEETRQKHEKERWIWIILLVSLLSLSIVFYLIAKMRKKDRDLTERMARFATLDSTLQDYQKSNAILVGSLFSERLLHMKDLSNQFFQADESVEKEMVFNAFKKDLEDFHSKGNIYSTLEKDLNTYCNDIVAKLKAEVPRIQGENLEISMLFFSGLPYGAIQLITKRSSIDSLKTLRHRIRNEIKNAKAPDAPLFLGMLEMKRTKKAVTK